MRQIDKLVADYYIEIGFEGALKYSASEFEIGFVAARRLIHELVEGSSSNPRYIGLPFKQALALLCRDILEVGDNEAD